MSRCLVTVVGALTILSGSLLPFDRAEAGASASAPSKYGHSSQVANVDQVSTHRQTRKSVFGITEYSSSSAKNASRKH
jgi:hypothetical protein